MIPTSNITKIAFPAGNIRQIRDSGFDIGQNRNAGRQNTTILQTEIRQKSSTDSLTKYLDKFVVEFDDAAHVPAVFLCSASLLRSALLLLQLGLSV